MSQCVGMNMVNVAVVKKEAAWKDEVAKEICMEAYKK